MIDYLGAIDALIVRQIGVWAANGGDNRFSLTLPAGHGIGLQNSKTYAVFVLKSIHDIWG